MLDDVLGPFQRQLIRDGASARVVQEYPQTLQRIAKELPHGLLNCTDAHLGRWRDQLQARLNNPDPLRRISRHFIRNNVAILRRFYDYCVAKRLMATNPARTIKSSGFIKWRPKPIPVDASRRLVRVIKPLTDPLCLRDRTMIELYYNSCRVSEACGLTTDRIRYDPERGSLSIEVLGKGRHGGKWRVVPLRQNSARYLALHVLAQFDPTWTERLARHLLVDGKSDRAGAPFRAVGELLEQELRAARSVFVRPDGVQFDKRTADRRFALWRDRAGLVAYTPHTFRHACCTRMHEAGEDINRIREIAGHEDIRTTQMYVEVSEAAKARGLERLGDLDDEEAA